MLCFLCNSEIFQRISLLAIYCSIGSLLLPSYVFPQDHRSFSALVFQMPNFRSRGMRETFGRTPQSESWGPQTGGFAPGIRGGRGGWLAMRGHLAGRYRPPPSDLSRPFCDATNERPPSAPHRGPSINNNRTFQSANRTEPERFTRFDNPAWGDTISDADANPEMGNRVPPEYNGR